MRDLFSFSFLLCCLWGCLNNESLRPQLTDPIQMDATPTPIIDPTPLPTPSPTPFISVSALEDILDPQTGTHKTKITIPKNYHGLLYLSGLNISGLSNRLITVRFKFGLSLAPIDIPATVALGSGLTPQIPTQLLVLDLKSRPFAHVRLLYDLFDYNSYDRDDVSSSPTQDIYNEKLYCRGLGLSYDPTFMVDSTKCQLYSATTCPYSMGACDAPTDQCFYAYAKIKDNVLYDFLTESPFTEAPLSPQVDLEGEDFLLSSSDPTRLDLLNRLNMRKCLSENGLLYYKQVGAIPFSHFSFFGANDYNVAGIGQVVSSRIVGESYKDYLYEGPYRLLDQSRWVLSKGAAVGSYGLFADTLSGNADDLSQGIYSYLFPRATRLSLGAGIYHVSSGRAFVPKGESRQLNSLASEGETLWMDGCNWRALSYDTFRHEGGGSCNVTASIELVTRDSNGNEIVLDATQKIKLQLVKASTLNTENKEIQYEAFKTCQGSRECGGNECCFNSRCWSKEIVGSCPDDPDILNSGQYQVGTSCQSDFQCLTLCCKQGRCSEHNPAIPQSKVCGKEAGESCVAREWCAQSIVRKCIIQKTGVDGSGKTTCVRQCYNVPTFGTCQQGICRAPIPDPVPAFDPGNPDCSTAVEPPLILATPLPQ